jgi:hypothetical protein
MGKVSKEEIISFIGQNIQKFHQARLENLLKLRLNEVLKRKNPYLFKAKNIATAYDLVKLVLDAHLSSQEEGIFGGFLEELAIFICGKVYRGRKSSAEGIDSEFEKDGVKYIVTIKSGPNWGNSRQISKMKDDFIKAKRVLRTNARAANIIAVNGCCYGVEDIPDKGEHIKLCGQRFWTFISGDDDLYTKIIEPLGFQARVKNDQFLKEYSKVINKFTREFAENYCSPEGDILWNKLVRFNSGKKKNLEAQW